MYDEVRLARYRLVEGEVHRAVVRAQRLDRTMPSVLAGLLDLLVLHLQVAHPHAHHRLWLPDPQQALGLLVPGVGGSRDAGSHGALPLHPVTREEHAELPAHPVLGRRAAVGVEQIALVQDGVGDRAQLTEVTPGALCGHARIRCRDSEHAVSGDSRLRHSASSGPQLLRSNPPIPLHFSGAGARPRARMRAVRGSEGTQAPETSPGRPRRREGPAGGAGPAGPHRHPPEAGHRPHGRRGRRPGATR
ncbi:hypothetical protein SGLAM104S_09321 [Streptomyces glaucescens]